MWVCSEDFRRDIPLSEEILGQVVRSYRTLRNTIKFQLGTLFDFSFEANSVEFESMGAIDLWALSRTNEMREEVTHALDCFELHRAVQVISRFCSGVLSSTYHDVIKDRLYTLHPDDPLRRSTQTAIHLIFETLVRIIGPIVPFTADEAWTYRHFGADLSDDALVLRDWAEPFDLGESLESDSDVSLILDFKDCKVNEALEELRSKKEIGQSLDAEVEITLSKESTLWAVLSRRESELAELFIVSSVILNEDSKFDDAQVEVRHAPGVRCPRSWRWVPELTQVDPWGEVSPRCAEVLAKLG